MTAHSSHLGHLSNLYGWQRTWLARWGLLCLLKHCGQYLFLQYLFYQTVSSLRIETRVQVPTQSQAPCKSSVYPNVTSVLLHVFQVQLPTFFTCETPESRDLIFLLFPSHSWESVRSRHWPPPRLTCSAVGDSRHSHDVTLKVVHCCMFRGVQVTQQVATPRVGKGLASRINHFDSGLRSSAF